MSDKIDDDLLYFTSSQVIESVKIIFGSKGRDDGDYRKRVYDHMCALGFTLTDSRIAIGPMLPSEVWNRTISKRWCKLSELRKDITGEIEDTIRGGCKNGGNRVSKQLISEVGLWGWIYDYGRVVFDTFRDKDGDFCYSCTLGVTSGVLITAPTLEGLLKEVWDYVLRQRGTQRK